jgi:hypothetical protein
MTMTTVLNQKMLTAKANARMIREASAKMAKCFVDSCIACWQVKEGQQYKDLGYSSMSAFLESEGIDMSRSQYDAMANVGRLLTFVDLSREELIGIGYSCAKELARLAPNKDEALVNAKDIQNLVTNRNMGVIPNHKAFCAEIDRLLGKGDGAGEGESEGEEKAEDWRTKYRSALAKADSEEAFLSMIQELIG